MLVVLSYSDSAIVNTHFGGKVFKLIKITTNMFQ